MAVTVIVHVMGEDPFLAELEELPDPTHQSIILMNPRRRDNQRLRAAPELLLLHLHQ